MANRSCLSNWKEEQARLQIRLREIEQKIKVSHDKLETIDALLNHQLARNQSTLKEIDAFLQSVEKYIER